MYNFVPFVFLLTSVRISRQWATTDDGSYDGCDCPDPGFGPDMWVGEMKSPVGSSGLYCNNLNCRYAIEPGYDGTAIRLHFESVDTENNHDYIQVIQTEGDKKFPMQKLSGSYTGDDFITSSGNGLELKFHSDGSVRRGGFVARFIRFNITEEDCACPPMFYSVTSNPGSIASPNAPGKYCNHIHCFYVLRTEPPYSIKLTLTSIDMAPQDSVKIFQGETNRTSVDNYLLTWTGRSLADVRSEGKETEITSRTHGFIVVFRSDSAALGTGFTASYEQVDSPCRCENEGPTQVSAGASGFLTSPAFPLSYCDDTECTYKFSTGIGYVVQYELNSLATEQAHDWLYVLDTANGNREIAQFSGALPPEQHRIITSNNRQSAIKFKSDSSVVDKGFNLTYRAIQRNSDCQCPIPQPRQYSSMEATFGLVQPKDNCAALDCVFAVNPPGELHRITMNITVLATSPNGFLTLYNGLIPSSRYMTKQDSYTSGRHEVNLNSDKGVTLHYHSESTAPGHGYGFNVSFSWKQRCNCGELELTADTAEDSPKRISSPDYPGNYCNNLDCKWTIRAPTGYKVGIRIESLKTEQSEDFLSVYDGTDTDDYSKRLRRLSGMTYGDTRLTSRSPEMTLKFHSDSSINYDGFTAVYFKVSTSTTPIPTTPRYRRTTSSPTAPRTARVDVLGPEVKSSKHTSGWAIFAVVLLVLIAIALTVFIGLYSTGRISLARFGIGTSNTPVGYVREDQSHLNGERNSYDRYADSSKVSLMDHQ